MIINSWDNLLVKWYKTQNKKTYNMTKKFNSAKKHRKRR